LSQKKAKDGVKLRMCQKKQTNSEIDVLRLDSELDGISAEDIIDFYIDPPEKKGMMEWKVIENKTQGDIQSFKAYMRL